MRSPVYPQRPRVMSTGLSLANVSCFTKLEVSQSETKRNQQRPPPAAFGHQIVSGPATAAGIWRQISISRPSIAYVNLLNLDVGSCWYAPTRAHVRRTQFATVLICNYLNQKDFLDPARRLHRISSGRVTARIAGGLTFICHCPSRGMLNEI
jgi:hypothetical protein